MQRTHSLRGAAALGAAALLFGCIGSQPPPAGEAPAAIAESKRRLAQDQGDLAFILDQIRIAEEHAAGAPLQSLVPSPLLPYGLRTVDGSFNNLLPGQSRFGAADQYFPRTTTPLWRDAEPAPFDPDGAGPLVAGSPSSYAQTGGLVFDSQPRLVSNLVVDQSAANPAAVRAAETTPGSQADVDGQGTFFIPNVAPDVGLSAPFNSWFTLFGQFFDHGLDLVQKGGSGTVFIPLQPGDPLYEEGSRTNFMVLTRATNHPGPDGVLGTGDDVHDHLNRTTAFVDQNQTYTSHPSHQVFLREYVLDAQGRPVATGRLLDGARGGIGNWAEVKAQARDLLGIALGDTDVHDVPLLATDPYGRFLRGPRGFAQLVTSAGLVEGDPAAPVGTADALRTGHPFLADIAHAAAPAADLAPDADDVAGGAPPPAGFYDDELLDAHFVTGDGRGNENIGLTAVHAVFHAEHNRLVGKVKELALAGEAGFLSEWLLPGANTADGVQELEWNGERLFQAARFGTEMQYQHLVFEEFARKVQPEVNVFAGYDSSINPAIMAEFAHTVYRFGHSMLTETVARTNPDGTPNDIGLVEAFLNPLAFAAGGEDDKQAAGAVIRGMTRQVGNEIDEFITGALRNNLVGLPLDLAAVNLARGRDTGIPPLNEARRMFFADSGGNSALRPYESWTDFMLGLRHPESVVNFVAAYGTHPDIEGAATSADKRAAAMAIVGGGPGAPADAVDFLNSTGAWATAETGLGLVDFWIGGLAEKQMVFGGLLGSTFNYVFETQMERLQDGDRFYYLARTAGLNFLTQLEENSFAELVMRNVPGVRHLPFDIFSRPAFIFELANLGTSGAIPDDPTTPEVDESQELVRMADGTVRYTGVEHVVLGGTPGDDRMRASEGDDTLWGDEGNDRLEGGDGNDALNGGPGDDIITDLNGIDNIKGGEGHDAINAGPGLGDLILAGPGSDFVVAGADPKETFAGYGNDYVFGGDSADVVFGGEGDDWVEGGGQADLLQGDNGNPFQDSTVVGNDVIIGGGGNDDYDSETGDDINVSDSGTERHEGMLGFDWVTYKGDTQPADADLFRRVLLPPDVDAIRDRFDLIEGLSGWDHDDVLRGDDRTSVDLAAVDATSGHNNALNSPEQIALVNGLQQLLGPVASFSGGNILLGGGGADVIEGRGGDDLIDGDAWLNVRISVVDEFGNEIGTADTMGGVLRNKAGALASTPSTLTLQAAVFQGLVNPGRLRIVREILTAPGGDDVAVFSDSRENYDIVDNADGSITVVHARGTLADGTDTLRNIERLQFPDLTPPVPVGLVATAGDGRVALALTAPADAVSVLVLRSTANFAASPADRVGQTVLLDGAPTASLADTGLANGTTCFYTAFARDAAGNVSAPATATATPRRPLALDAFTPTGGPAGTVVTLSGTGFTGATAVFFGATPATFAVVGDTQITTTVPAGATTAQISVTGPGGVSTSIGVFTVTAPAVPTQVFADTFDACTATTNLGPNWTVNGRFYCSAGRARGEVAASIATANTAVFSDMTAQARVNLSFSTTTGSGVVVRAAGNTSYYAARVLATNRLQLVRVSGGSTTVLADAPATTGVGVFRTLRLSVSGSNPVQLGATYNGVTVSATDTTAARLLSGRAGLLSGTTARTQYDDFSLQAVVASVPPPPPPPPPPSTVVNFADNFNACTSTTNLGPNWTVNGRWYCAAQRARGEVATSIATANTASMADTFVEARVNLATANASGSGVVARASGGSYYAARLLNTQRLQIIRVTAAGTTVLADVAASAPAGTFVRVRLEATGAGPVQLTASIGGVPVATATDSSPQALLSGYAGLLSGTTSRTQFDDATIRSL